MNITYTSKDGRLTVAFEASEPKQIVKTVASLQEIFEEDRCGKCQSERIRCSHNSDKDNHDYYKLRCLDCGAQIDFGQHKTGGTLFIKRHTEEDGRRVAMPNHGWYVYGGEQQERPQEQPKTGYASTPAPKQEPAEYDPMKDPVVIEAGKMMSKCTTLINLQHLWQVNWATGARPPKQAIALQDVRDKHKKRLGWKG